MNRKRWIGISLLFATAAIAAGASALMPTDVQPTEEALRLCPFSKIYCLDVWDPVTCDNGVTYSNACYARRACATGCVPGYPSW